MYLDFFFAENSTSGPLRAKRFARFSKILKEVFAIGYHGDDEKDVNA